MTFFIALFVLLMQFLWKYIDDLIGKGLEWYIIAELMMYASASLVPLALPLAILLSSIMTMGNMGEHYELVAMKSAGFSLPQIMRPLIFLTVLICFTAFYFSNNILPVANLKFGTLLYDITHQKPAIEIKEGVFYNGIDGYTIRIGKKEKNGELLKNIMIYDHTSRTGSNKVILAEEGTMKITPNNQYMLLNLLDGYSYDEQNAQNSDKKNYPLVRSQFKEQVIRMDLSGFKLTRTDEELFKDNYQMLNLSQLQVSINELKEEKNKRTVEFSNHITDNFYRNKPKYSISENLDSISDSTSVTSKTDNIEMGDTLIVHKNNAMTMEVAANTSVNNEDTTKVKPKDLRDNFLLRNRPAKKKESVIQADFQKADSSQLVAVIALTDTNQLTDTLLAAKEGPLLLEHFTRSEKILAIETATNLVRSAKAYTESFVSDIENRDKYINRHLVEWHRKITLSFACMILFLIGAPLGAIIRKGGLGMPVVISFIFFILFHVISITGEKFVKENVMPPYIGMWLASFILLPIGLFLTYKAARDSVIFDLDFYSAFMKKFKKKETGQ
ncbi:MAG: LptF/LptG family permease [Bacteroidetes bacterium]|nr:LptF/LptG family permease [Bacteroidota bacterium]